MIKPIEKPDVILVRHGHSAGNAGKQTSGFAEISLEEQGHQQAQLVAADIVESYGTTGVSHVITTPYLRTQQTAEPLIAHTGCTPLVRPDWREITYLQPKSADGKTYEERAALRDIFWAATRLNPNYTDEGEAQLDSANSFLYRVRKSLGELSTLAANNEGVVVVYAHEFPISAALNIAQGKEDEEIIADMVRLQKPSPHIDNTQAVGLTLQDGRLVLAQDAHVDLFSESRHKVS